MISLVMKAGMRQDEAGTLIRLREPGLAEFRLSVHPWHPAQAVGARINLSGEAEQMKTFAMRARLWAAVFVILGVSVRAGTPFNDDFANRPVINSGFGSFMPGTVVGATLEPGEPVHDASATTSLWYGFLNPYDCIKRFQVTLFPESSLNTYLGIYTGGAVDELTRVSGYSEGPGRPETLLLDALPGVVYNIVVAGLGEVAGTFTLIFHDVSPNCPSPTPTPTPGPTPVTGRAAGDFNASGCTDIYDFLILLDHWGQDFEGTAVGLDDFLNIIENWQTGAGCQAGVLDRPME